MVVELRNLARRMLADYDARTPSRLFAELVDFTTEQAYALQEEVTRLREQRGEKAIGYKIGCTSAPIQEQLGVTEPIFGRLFDTGCLRSGECLSYKEYVNLAVEGELAVRLCKDLSGAPLSEREVLEAIGAVFVVIELHNYDLQSPALPGPELIAKSGLHAGLVLADSEAISICRWESLDNMSIRINDVAAETTSRPWTMGGPVESLRWLGARLKEFGLRLKRDQTILTGSSMRLYPVTPGVRICVEARPFGQCCAEVGP